MKLFQNTQMLTFKVKVQETSQPTICRENLQLIALSKHEQKVEEIWRP